MDRLDDAEDKRLMAALAAGEDVALNRLIERWQGRVRSFVFRSVQNLEDTEDLVQETFVRVFRHRSRYQPASRFSTWLFTIALNLCRNHVEKKQRRGDVSLEALQEARAPTRQYATAEPGPVAQLDRVERAAAVQAAIAALPIDLRTAVVLFEYEELSHVEIAAIAETTPKAIETRLYRARHLLRVRLALLLEG